MTFNFTIEHAEATFKEYRITNNGNYVGYVFYFINSGNVQYMHAETDTEITTEIEKQFENFLNGNNG